MVKSGFDRATLVPSQGELRAASKGVTVERIERAIRIVADMTVKHNRPRLIDTIDRLEDELKRLRSQRDPMEKAKQILSKNVHNNVHNID